MKMKAAIVNQFGAPLDICEVEAPVANDDEILVKVEAAGVCHTDLHAAEGDWPVKPGLPFIPGHEGVGIVTAVGKNVRHVKEGDRVGVPWLYSSCTHCRHCLGGWETLCENQKNTGYSVNGSFAEYLVANPDFVAHIPPNLDLYQVAPILCAGITVYKGLKMLDAKAGDWVAISGIGGLGHLAIQYAKAMGFNVAAVDICQDKLSMAKSLGADIVINAMEEDPGKVLHEKINGAHGVLVTAVSLKAFEQAQAMVRRGATITLNGLPPGSFPVSIFDMVLNGITIRGSIVGTRLDMREALDFAAAGKINAVVEIDRLQNINHVFDKMRSGKINGRIVIDING